MVTIRRSLTMLVALALALPAWSQPVKGVANNPNANAFVFLANGDNSLCLHLLPSLRLASGLFTAHGWAQGDEGLNVAFVWRCDEDANLIEPWSFDDDPLPNED